jgi:hypothetical protein
MSHIHWVVPQNKLVIKMRLYANNNSALFIKNQKSESEREDYEVDLYLSIGAKDYFFLVFFLCTRK